MATRLKIHPAIGIARVGNSPETFLGPEVPGTFAQPGGGSYRDSQGRLRRQAVRFRVFETDEANPNAAPVEVVAGQGGVAHVDWTVHLANKKSVWFDFDGVTGEGPGGYPAGHPLRNAAIIDPVERARKLIIDPGPRTIGGVNQRVEIAQGGWIRETWPGPLAAGKEIVSLGTLSTDEAGRLIAAGGYGVSGTTGELPASGALNYDDNDGWFDDVSDGPVTATVVYHDGTRRTVDAGAWLMTGPPDYAPPIENQVTMWDLLYDLGLRFHGLDPAVFDPTTKQFSANFRPSYTRDVYPILRRGLDYRWVSRQAASHQPPHFDYALLGAAPAPGEPAANPRSLIFNRMRDPANLNDTANPQRNMPRLHNDGIGGVPPESFRLTVTVTQYEILKRWSAGKFVADWAGTPVPGTAITPHGLDRAALEAGCGGAFFPGMEASWNLRDPGHYTTPFEYRFQGYEPGDVTKRSALPWQADFLKCGNNWWPAQRPNQVRPNATATAAVEWARGIESHLDLVEQWWQLGIVVPAADPASAVKYHERDRILTS